MEEICSIALDEIRAAYPERVFRLETSGELEGRFDGERLQQVLSNLLNNAVQHGEPSRADHACRAWRSRTRSRCR